MEIESHYSAHQCEFFTKYSYDRESALGEGCTGSVFSCQKKGQESAILIEDGETQYQPDLVVKVTRSDDETKVQAAQHEAKLLKQLPQHPNIVRYVDTFFHE